MDRDRWRLAKSIFQAALELPLAERETYVARNCSDTSMRDEVLKMVQLHRDQTDFLRSPWDASEARSPHTPSAAAGHVFDKFIGHRFDNFEIVRRIGSGGMGTVFEARQQHPQRAAAIKIVNPSRAFSEKDLLRFEHEAEILARLQHPGIAQVYAAGWHDFGHGQQPWFAMELIDGQPLHHFAAGGDLTSKQKIRLLLAICDAVVHAHGRGVIHRDLKPANILIVQVDHQPNSKSPLAQPKIVDFGVARVIDADRQATLQTAAGDILGTINYMSPEQVAADPLSVDERCDVYALGVIGYELLAGCLPHDRRGGSIAASLRRVEQDQPRPLGQVNTAFRGDLQVIFDKALEQDAARRYGSVQQFADDLNRYLHHQPISARPASTAYQVRKFVSRHRALVGGTATTFAALVIGIVLYASEARQARIAAAHSQYEAEKATAVSNFMTNDFLMKLLAAAHGGEVDQRLPAAELVNRSADKVHAMFGDRPTIEAAVRNEVGTVYYNLGSFRLAAEEFNQALQLWQDSLGPDHADTLKAVNNLGQCYNHLGQREEAERMLRRALEGRIRVLSESDAATLVSMNNLADFLLRESGRIDEAEALFRRALRLQQLSLGSDHKNTLVTMINLGTVLRQRKKLDEAQALHRQAYQSSCRSLGEDHIMSLQSGSCYAQTLYQAGEYQDALMVLLPITQAFERLFGAANGETITARRLLARIYRDSGQVEAAKAQLQQAVQDLQSTPDPPAATMSRLRNALRQLDNSAPVAVPSP